MEKNRNSDKKKILLITGGFFPVNNPRSVRATELAKEFVRQGHSVVIYTPKLGFDYTEYERANGFVVKDLGDYWISKFPIRGNKASRIIRRAINRLLQIIFEFPEIQLFFKVKRVLKSENNYDILISNAVPYPIHWGVASIWHEGQTIAKKWIADCGDPYMGNRIDSYRKLFYFKYIEKWFCRRADYITIPAEDHLHYYYQEFRNKFRVIPQGFHFPETDFPRVYVKNRLPTFAFAGRFLPKFRDPKPLLDFLVTLKSDFRFVVFSPNVEFLTPYKSIMGEKLDIRGYVPREDLLDYLSQVDFLLHIEFHSSVMSNSPSKFADYAFVKRPILALSMQKLNKELILKFLEGNYENQMVIKNPERFRIETVAKQFLDLGKP